MEKYWINLEKKILFPFFVSSIEAPFPIDGGDFYDLNRINVRRSWKMWEDGISDEGLFGIILSR